MSDTLDHGDVETCEGCEKQFPVEQMRMTDDDCWLCGDCYAECPRAAVEPTRETPKQFALSSELRDIAAYCANSGSFYYERVCLDAIAEVERLRAQLAEASRDREEESRWLLGYIVGGPKWVARFKSEQSSIGGGVYQRHSFEHVFPVETTDANEALGFCRERDAMAMLESISYPYRGILRVEEHIWTDTGRTPDSARALSPGDAAE
jgi:hypothetical protein